jgi:type I restriction enzyme S subunit
MNCWDVYKIGELCDVITGSTPSRTNPEYWNEGSVPWFTVDDIRKGGRVIYNTIQHVTDKAAKESSLRLMPVDTVLLCCTASVGEYAITRVPIASNQQFNGLVIKSEFKDKLSPDFLFNVASTLKEKLKAFCGKTSVDFVSGSNLKSIQIPLPPLAEQRKIAEILRTWDEAIETAEAELKAKQERKRWLMDKLLRLGTAEFSRLSESDWTAQRLGDILEIRHGKNQREVETPEGRYPILGTGGIIGRTNAFLYDKPSVLIGRKGTIDRPQYMDTPFWTIDTLFYTSISDRAIPRFIFYVFCTINWQQYNAATGVPSLAASTIESIKIQLPPLAEQRRIADILQAVDADAEVINCRIETLRAQKRGLMQKLLTGEVRVNP